MIACLVHFVALGIVLSTLSAPRETFQLYSVCMIQRKCQGYDIFIMTCDPVYKTETDSLT